MAAKPVTFLWLFSLLLSAMSGPALSETAQSQTEPRPVQVVFQDGVAIEVIDWTFIYEWREGSECCYTGHRMGTRDLLLELRRRTERSATLTEQRKILASRLVSMRYGFPENEAVSKGVTIELAGGETIRVDDVVASPLLVSPRKPDAWQHRVSLQGKAYIEQKLGVFHRDMRWQAPGMPGETIVEFRFR